MTAGCGDRLEALVSERAPQRPLGPSVASGLMPDAASASGTASALLRYAPTLSVRRMGGRCVSEARFGGEASPLDHRD